MTPGNTAQPRPITSEGHYLYGYYGICPWNSTGELFFAIRSPFMDREPTAHDPAEIGVIEPATGEFHKLAETRAWNFQQGCFLHWLGTEPDRKLIYNNGDRNGFFSMVLDVQTGEKRRLPYPVGAVSRNGKFGITLNFARLNHTRPGYGYSGLTDRYATQLRPECDGAGLLNIETGEHQMVVTMPEAYGHMGKPADIQNSIMWFNHVLFNTHDTRFALLCRWKPPQAGRLTAMFTANVDGSDLRRQPLRDLISHYDWRDERHILAWARLPSRGDKFWLVPDGAEEADCVPIGDGILTQDGHCSYSADKRWILDDTYPDRQKNERVLKQFNVEENREVILGGYYSDPKMAGPIRCDLHPCWNRDDTQVCFHSIHEGRRAIYVMDVAAYTKG